jgi:hypothetical protein
MVCVIHNLLADPGGITLQWGLVFQEPHSPMGRCCHAAMNLCGREGELFDSMF